jgi:hypothetical protein
MPDHLLMLLCNALLAAAEQGLLLGRLHPLPLGLHK